MSVGGQWMASHIICKICYSISNDNLFYSNITHLLSVFMRIVEKIELRCYITITLKLLSWYLKTKLLTRKPYLKPECALLQEISSYLFCELKINCMNIILKSNLFSWEFLCSFHFPKRLISFASSISPDDLNFICYHFIFCIMFSG